MTEQELKNEISKYFHAKKHGMKQDRAIRFAEEIKDAAQDYAGQDNWINKFKNGNTIKNKYGAKISFVFGN